MLFLSGVVLGPSGAMETAGVERVGVVEVPTTAGDELAGGVAGNVASAIVDTAASVDTSRVCRPSESVDDCK